MTKPTFTDPIGPGTSAWIEAERAVSLWLEGQAEGSYRKLRAANCAIARMTMHLKAHGRADAIADNKAWIKRERLDPTYEY